MINKNSLKYQFKKQLAISIGLLVIIFAFMLDQIFYAGIATAMQRSMLSMAGHYAQQVNLDPDFELPEEGKYSVFVGKQAIRPDIKALFDIDAMGEVKFAVHGGGDYIKMSNPNSLSFLVVHPLRQRSEKLYLFYQNRPVRLPPSMFVSGAGQNRPPPRGRPEQQADFPPPHHENRHGLAGAKPPKQALLNIPEERPLLSVPESIGFIIIIAILLIYWVVRRLIGSVLTPLNELATMAKSIDETKPDLPFKVLQNRTEIGLVATTLQKTMQRIHDHHQREKRFLQNASHELRTPIAVVSSALDIIDLRHRQGNTQIADQHDNIRRANKNMAELSAALLFLNTNKGANQELQQVELAELAKRLVNEHAYLLEGKALSVEVVCHHSQPYSLPMALCRIVLSNLIRNAFEHTLEGSVVVDINALVVTISNSEAGIEDCSAEHSQGFGLGLNIVAKIAAQQQWQMNLSSDPQSGSKVVFSFQTREACQ